MRNRLAMRKKRATKKTRKSRPLPRPVTIIESKGIMLTREYDVIRTRYFGKTIPPVGEVLIGFLSRREIARLCRDEDEETDGLCSFGMYRGTPCPKAILLADDLSETDEAITLRHEMAHMKVNLRFKRLMGEGKHWKKEIRRLVAAGAYDGWL